MSLANSFPRSPSSFEQSDQTPMTISAFFIRFAFFFRSTKSREKKPSQVDRVQKLLNVATRYYHSKASGSRRGSSLTRRQEAHACAGANLVPPHHELFL